MDYEEEQKKYSEELKQICSQLQALDKIFEDPKLVDYKIQCIVEQIHTYDIVGIESQSWHRRRLEFKLKQELERDYREKKARKSELEHLLSQSPSERTAYNIKKGLVESAKFMGSITPQHVSGRLYKVENGDGCGTFCLWFCIIDAILVFLFWLIWG